MNSSVEISIVIVNWNTKQHVLNCLRSIFETRGVLHLQVVVVDNCSSDGSADAIAEQFPEVQIIRASENFGFAKGNNLGLKLVSGRFVALVNSDVILRQNCLQALQAFMLPLGDVGLCGPRVCWPDGSFQPSCKRTPSLTRKFSHVLGLHRLGLKSWGFAGYHMDESEHVHGGNIEVLVGCFWFARKEALDEVGGLDERFFMYGEDDDWCMRFRRAGWRLSYCKDAMAVHVARASSSKEPERFKIEQERAVLQYWEKWRGRTGKWIYLSLIVLNSCTRLALGVGLFLLFPADRDFVKASIRRHWACIRWISGGAEL